MKRIVFIRGKQKEMLMTFILHKKKSQLTAAELLGVPRRSFRNWITEERTLPSEVFKKMLRIDPKLDSFSVHISHILDENWGKVKGGKNCYAVLMKKYGESEFIRRRRAGGKSAITLRLDAIRDNLPSPDDPRVLELLGALIGDGWIGISGRRKQVCYCGNISQQGYAKHLQKLLQQTFRIRGYLKLRKEFSVFYIIINSGPVFDFFRENFDFPVGQKHRFNSQLLPSEWKGAVHVLRGIFDTDGGIYFDKAKGYARPYPVIDITSHNPELLDWISDVLSEKGFKLIRLKFNIRLKTVSQVDRWFNEIKPSNKVHIQKWNRWKSQYAGP